MRKRRTSRLARTRRARRSRARVRGTALRPRLSVFRSHRHIWAQLIDDEHGYTLLACSDLGIRSAADKTNARQQPSNKPKRRKESIAFLVGQELAQRARTLLGIRAVKFDRGSYRYHGRVAEVAEGARAAGLRL